MRISELARAAGVSTRSVRLYHQLGVLPEPPREPNGYRAYSFEDLTRLLRLRWLAESGLPLAVAGIAADHDEHDLLEQIDSALGALEERLSEVWRQRRLLTDLRNNLAAGRRLSPLPVRLNEIFETFLERAEAPEAREAILAEREALEAMALAGGATPELFHLYAEALGVPDATNTVLPLLGRYGALRGTDPQEQREEIRTLAAEIGGREPIAQFLRYAVGQMPAEVATRHSGGDLRGVPTLADVVPDPAQRAVLNHLLARVRS